MEPSVVDPGQGEWLDRRAVEWVDAGLISSDQAEAIRRFERDTHPPARLSVVAEVAAYLASVIAVGGGAAIVAPNWSQLGTVGQMAVALAVAVVGFVAGHRLVALGEPGTVRLGSFLWVVATGGLALAAAAVIDAVEPHDDASWAIVIGTVVLVAGGVMWRNLDRPLQLATTAVGLGVAATGWFELIDVRIWAVATIMWVAAAVLGVVTVLGYLHPRGMALAIAAVGMMFGAFQLAERSERISARGGRRFGGADRGGRSARTVVAARRHRPGCVSCSPSIMLMATRPRGHAHPVDRSADRPRWSSPRSECAPSARSAHPA